MSTKGSFLNRPHYNSSHEESCDLTVVRTKLKKTPESRRGKTVDREAPQISTAGCAIQGVTDVGAHSERRRNETSRESALGNKNKRGNEAGMLPPHDKTRRGMKDSGELSGTTSS